MFNKTICFVKVMCCCCDCFGFIRRQRRQRPEPAVDNNNNLFHLLQALLSGDCIDNDDHVYNDSEVQACPKRSQDILNLRVENGMMCKQFTVKETHKLIRSKDKDGNKMINEYIRECKIGLGAYGKMDDNDELRRSPGTPVFTAPECIIGGTYHGKAADTWAVGITLYCMILETHLKIHMTE